MQVAECPNIHKFDEIKQKYDRLTPGEKAEIKKVSTPEKTRNCIAFYKIVPDGESPKQWARIVFMLPWFASCKSAGVKYPNEASDDEILSCKQKDEENGVQEISSNTRKHHVNGIGEIMALSDVPRQSVNKMILSRYPRDIEYLRRIVNMCVTRGFRSIDWNVFGKSLYFWGERQKELILQTYYEEMVRLRKIK